MNPSGASPGDNYERPFREPELPPQEDDGELMRQVLEETMAATDRERPIDPGELQALRAVARKYVGQTLNVDPIARDLVAAVLDSRFANSPLSASLRQSMAARIAETLYDLAPARERLESLWTRLHEDTG